METYFTPNMAFTHQLQLNFPEAVLTEDFASKLTYTEPHFSVTLQDFSDLRNNLENLVKPPKY